MVTFALIGADVGQCMQISKKIKSMQMFKRPVQSCKQVWGPLELHCCTVQGGFLPL